MPEACTGLKPVEEEEGEGEEGAHPTADGPTPTAYFGTNHLAMRRQARRSGVPDSESLFLMSRKNGMINVENVEVFMTARVVGGISE